ncbi:MAG: exonuclease SbcCD subunit D [Anaerolineae bacterium]|nr:exonuclease SbcCD subunit D [Anaerolineae bacterium]
MSDPIRILHFADAHIGLEAYGRTDPETGLSSRAEDFFARLAEVRDHAAAHGADLAIFGGDAFQTRNPSPTYQREFARFVRDLAALCPVLLLVGNHDLPASAGKAASIEIYATLGVPNVIVGVDYALHRIETVRGPVQVAAAPYPVRARLLAEGQARGLTLAELDAALEHALVDRLRALAEEADSDPAPRVLAGHFSVRGARPGSEQANMLGRDVTVPLEALTDRRWDYVALGHRHRHQVLTLPGSIPPVVYSGSLERLDFSEEGEPKGFCWAEVARGAASWRFVPLAARPFVTVRADARDSRDPTAAVLAAAEELEMNDAIVRVIVALSETNAHLLQEGAIRRALFAAGADHVAAIQVEVAHPVHARLGASPERLPPEELVRRYFEGKSTPPDRLRDLLDAAREILSDEEA